MKIHTKKLSLYLFVATFIVFPLFFNLVDIKSAKSKVFYDSNNLQNSKTFDTPIVINDLPGSLNNWIWAKEQGYCTGSGTMKDPYTIKNRIFNVPSMSTELLVILNSQKYVVIKDCHFIGYWVPGILLNNVTNANLIENSMTPNTGALIYIQNSSNNIISDNNASNGYVFGIVLNASPGHTRNNTISNNIVSGNLDVGICLHPGCENNIISENIIIDNGNYGIALYDNTSGNNIYLNCFNNTSNALDNGLNNHWDNGVTGNYWDDYISVDTDENGIGDSAYTISGSAGSQDNYPLMKCPEKGVNDGIPGYNVSILIYSFVIVILGICLKLKKKRI